MVFETCFQAIGTYEVAEKQSLRVISHVIERSAFVKLFSHGKYRTKNGIDKKTMKKLQF